MHLLLERELRRLGDTTECKANDSVDEMRSRRAKQLASERHQPEDKTLYIGLDGRLGTFSALVDYELEQRVLASNPGSTLGTMTATVAAVRGNDTDEIRAAGQLGNAVQEIGGGLARPDSRNLVKPTTFADAGRPQ